MGRLGTNVCRCLLGASAFGGVGCRSMVWVEWKWEVYKFLRGDILDATGFWELISHGGNKIVHEGLETDINQRVAVECSCISLYGTLDFCYKSYRVY